MKTIKERFDSKFIPEPNTGCWIWTTAFNLLGYGMFSINNKNDHAHRVSYKLYVGPIPKGLNVCHTCDNRWCVNPDHLFLGTAYDNVMDKVNKGRCPSGENHKNSKLNYSKVKEIREMYSNGYKQNHIAKFFSISTATINQIVSNKTWKNI